MERKIILIWLLYILLVCWTMLSIFVTSNDIIAYFKIQLQNYPEGMNKKTNLPRAVVNILMSTCYKKYALDCLHAFTEGLLVKWCQFRFEYFPSVLYVCGFNPAVFCLYCYHKWKSIDNSRKTLAVWGVANVAGTIHTAGVTYTGWFGRKGQYFGRW